ncbi:hypothetical protein [Spirosoma montaniterrae]|uniref:3-keto-disaccharide hydrolase domain-containing protein n=1 Tax=Spirosoma montaniterrae TaxID=1178516 RepID=A0A1P9WWD0_9BACT|nr:hypothetical protein [Spirosoma montaniterrae]AQG79684.1 hypothetical protein AWR27_10300 [Spirosoma montaniterrae]
MKIAVITLLSCLLPGMSGYAQTISFKKRNDPSHRLQPVQVSMSIERFNSKQALKVIKDSTIEAVDEPTFVKLAGVDVKDGIIEVNVLSRLLKNAPELARGFIGVAFRVNADNSKFEGIYVRPTNARANDQLRRNRSIQYFSYPDYKFDRLRKEAPGQFESYADMGLNEWIKLRIEVMGKEAKLFINDAKQPSLVVTDLKHGSNASGAIGLWVDVGTEGYFADVKIRSR